MQTGFPNYLTQACARDPTKLEHTITTKRCLREISSVLYATSTASGDVKCDRLKRAAQATVRTAIPAQTPTAPTEPSSAPPKIPPKKTPINCDEAKTPIAVPRALSGA